MQWKLSAPSSYADWSLQVRTDGVNQPYYAYRKSGESKRYVICRPHKEKKHFCCEDASSVEYRYISFCLFERCKVLHIHKSRNIARLAQSVERETLSLSRSNRHDYSVHLKVVGSTPTSGFWVILFCIRICFKHTDAAAWYYLFFWALTVHCHVGSFFFSLHHINELEQERTSSLIDSL